MDWPAVSALVVSYNSKKFVKACVDSLLNQDYPKNKIEVVVADNASTDGSVEFLKETYGDKIKLVVLEKNTGFSGGTNAAYKAAANDYILYFNVDAYAEKDFLKSLMKVALSDDDIALVGGLEFPPGTDLDKSDYKGAKTMNFVPNAMWT